ncbi:MAG: hypothetical protein WAV25_00315 [Minisyncoccia bacterium]
MSIDFQETAYSKEIIEGPDLKIIPPNGDRNWTIAFDSENLDELSAYDRAVDGILHIEILMPHLNKRSTQTHHEWEIGDNSLKELSLEDGQYYFEELISRIRLLAQENRKTKLAA